MQLGKFSLSLAVKDLAASRAFYAKLGFEAVAGNPEQNWQVLRNGDVTIGIFQGMFDENILTFNPGWDAEKNTLEDFEDVREIQARLKGAGVELQLETDPEGTGIGHIVLADPDGNQIMFDQHVPAPGHGAE
ncbi:MAG: VOC family protein [Acidobacteria bacterium]|nr:VOC family protein [Acidobacteriota bacterium]